MLLDVAPCGVEAAEDAIIDAVGSGDQTVIALAEARLAEMELAEDAVIAALEGQHTHNAVI